MWNIMLVGIGGAIGSIARYLLNGVVQDLLADLCELCGKLIGEEGFIGSVLRFLRSLLSFAIRDWSMVELFPLGTLVINVLGCMTIGILAELAEAREAFTPETRAFVFIGILGGFTTYSTFGREGVDMLRSSQMGFALIYIGGHLVLGLGAVWLGRVLAHQIWG